MSVSSAQATFDENWFTEERRAEFAALCVAHAEEGAVVRLDSGGEALVLERWNAWGRPYHPLMGEEVRVQSGDRWVFCPGDHGPIQMSGVDNVALVGIDATLITDATSQVVVIEDSTNIQVIGLHVTHDAPTYCSGNCIVATNVDGLMITENDIDGSGVVGVLLTDVANAQVRANTIHHCEFGARLIRSDDVVFSNNTFRDNSNENVEVLEGASYRGALEEMNAVVSVSNCVADAPGASVGDLNADGTDDFMATFDTGYQNLQVELYVSDAGCMRTVWSGYQYLQAPTIGPLGEGMPAITDCQKDGPYIFCRRSEWNGATYSVADNWGCWNTNGEDGHDERCDALGYEAQLQRLETLREVTIAGVRPGSAGSEVVAALGVAELSESTGRIDELTGEVVHHWMYPSRGLSITLAGAPDNDEGLEVRFITAEENSPPLDCGLYVGMSSDDSFTILEGEDLVDESTYSTLSVEIELGRVVRIHLSAFDE